MKFILISLIVLALILAPTLGYVTYGKQSKADRSAEKKIEKALEKYVGDHYDKYCQVGATTTTDNKTKIVYDKPCGTPPPSNGTTIPSGNETTEPQVCNRNEHLENGVCVPDSTTTPAVGFDLCMVGDFKDASVFDAMKKFGCDFRVALGDNGYGSDLKLLKSIAPDHCVVGNHDAAEDGSAAIYKEALAYCGNSWWTKLANGSVLILGFNTNGDIGKQVQMMEPILGTSPNMQGIKAVIAVSHKGGHVFPNAHHPAEAASLYSQLEPLIPNGVKLYEAAGHNHNSAAAPEKNWYIAGNGGKSFYTCGSNADWTFCDNTHKSFLQFIIDNNNGTITPNFIDTSGNALKS